VWIGFVETVCDRLAATVPDEQSKNALFRQPGDAQRVRELTPKSFVVKHVSLAQLRERQVWLDAKHGPGDFCRVIQPSPG
jgi:hypothetical protein